MTAQKIGTISVTASSAAGAAASTPLKGLANYESLGIVATITGGAGGTLDVYFQTSHDDGTTWNDIAHLTQIASSAAATIYSLGLANDSSQVVTAGIKIIGASTAPALASNSIAGFGYGNQLRMLCVSGSGTSGGVAQTATIFGYRHQ